MKAKKMLVLLLAGVLTLGCCSMSVMAEEIDSPLMEAEVAEEEIVRPEEELFGEEEEFSVDQSQASYAAIDYHSKAKQYRVTQIPIHEGGQGADCAIASIASVLAYHDESTAGKYDAVRSKNGGGVYINSWGAFNMTSISVSPSSLYSALQEGPVIVHRSGHYSVVVGFVGGELSYSNFRIMEVQAYLRNANATDANYKYGYYTSWYNNYDQGSNIPLSEWGTVDQIIKFNGGGSAIITPGYIFTNSATNITETSATINGSLNTTVTTMSSAGFWFGTDTVNWKQYDENITKGTEVKKIYYGTEKWVGPLTPGTTYYYKFYAFIDGATYYSDVSSFTTTGTAPNKNYTLSFDAGGGTISFASVTMTLDWGNSWNVSYQNPQRANSTFLGWYDAYGHKVYEPNGECTNEGTYFRNSLWVYEGDLTVYAKWQNTITLDPKGGTIKGSATCPVVNGWGNYNSMTFQYPEKSGCVFYGWFDNDGWCVFDSAGNNTNDGKYFSNDAWVYPGNVTLHARWQNKITFDTQGGTITGTNYMEPVYGWDWCHLVGGYTPKKTGYTFLGWYDSNNVQVYNASGNSTNEGKYFKSNNWVYGKDVTLYAHWKSNSTSGGNTSGGSSSGGTSATKRFVDVPDGQFYTTAVDWAVANGVTTGTSSTTFSPNDSCKRGQVVAFLWRAYGCPEPSRTYSPFTDVQDKGKYYYKAVLWAVERGITTGTSPTTFSPEDTVTRGQFVSFLYRSKGSPAVSGGCKFTDVSSGKYYYKPIIWAAQTGVTTGTSPTTFSPENPCTRGQVVTFIYRAMK